MTRYHPILVTLHWLLALMIILALVMGSVVLAETPNSDPAKMFALQGHMTLGIAILALMLVRLVTRLTTAKPPHAETGNALLDRAGQWAHVGFYLLIFAMCASGLALANAAGLPGIVFGGSGAPLPEDFWGYGPRMAHGIIAKLLMLLILAHVAGFAFHQFVHKDGLIRRMWFGDRNA